MQPLARRVISLPPSSGSPFPTEWADYGASNRIAVPPAGGPSSSQGTITYNGPGVVTYDGINGYTLDSEDRVCNLVNSVTGQPYTNIYDAGGHRVAKGTVKSSGTCYASGNGFAAIETTILGPGGEQYTALGPGGGWSHGNVYAGSELLATYDSAGLHYALNDWLGTKRTQVLASGAIEQTWQSLPFGDNPSPMAEGGASQHHFTGKLHDNESQLDYFQARYYSSNMGRFLSPDWSAKEEPVPYAKLDNPQTLNLYTYVVNNPLRFVDADGHEVDLGNLDKKQRDEAQRRILANVNSKERGLFKSVTGKDGVTRLVLDKAAAANYEGSHSAGYGMLNQAIDSKATATVTIGDFQTVGITTYDVGAAGGGKFVPLGNKGDSAVLLSEHPDPANNAPTGIIAGHELLGHARLHMEGKPSGETEAQAVENRLRLEQHLPPRPKDDY